MQVAAADAPPASARAAAAGDAAGTAPARRRFAVATGTGLAVAAVPFVWTLWALWQGANPLRQTLFEDNYYDLQARAIFHGHLWVPRHSLGIEGFVHHGREFTYFGLFPSILRMPVLAVTSSLDAKLTAPSILLAWLVTMVVTTMLLWRLRLMLRGPVALGVGESALYGLFVLTVGAGSVFVYLASVPFVFHEDLAWSVALTVAALFALLGVVEAPSRGRLAAAGLLILAANLDRLTTGWATVLGAVALAAWFASGRAGTDRRRWWPWLAAAGLLPLAAGSLVNWLKFGTFFGLPVTEQVWSHINAHRQAFLRAHHGSEVGVSFVPADLVAYLRPDGIRISDVFPFVELPARPAPSIAGVIYDRRYRTASITASMPLLFLLSCFALVRAFAPRPDRARVGVRILLLAAGSAGAALLLWGYIGQRYLADFLPLLVLGGAAGLVWLTGLLPALHPPGRRALLGAAAVLGAFELVANLGIADTPGEEWTVTQTANFLQAQLAVSDAAGHPLQARIRRVGALPPYAPAEEVRVVGACDGLYLSDGEDYSTVPSEQHQRATWLAAERGPAYQHELQVTFAGPATGVPLVRAGDQTVAMTVAPATGGRLLASFAVDGPGTVIAGFGAFVPVGATRDVTVVTDEAKHLVQVQLSGGTLLQGDLPGGTATTPAAVAGTTGGVTVAVPAALQPRATLCHRLLGG